jgi:hypothetical protein
LYRLYRLYLFGRLCLLSQCFRLDLCHPWVPCFLLSLLGRFVPFDPFYRFDPCFRLSLCILCL